MNTDARQLKQLSCNEQKTYINKDIHLVLFFSAMLFYLCKCKDKNKKLSIYLSANSAGPDEMLHFAASYLGLHYLPKYILTGFQQKKGLNHAINM